MHRWICLGVRLKFRASALTANAALSGAEPALSAERPLEGTVRGENPGDETT